MILLMRKILSGEECSFIANWILTNEEYVKSLGPDDYTGTSDNSLSGRHKVFNYLNVPEIESILVPKLREVFTELNFRFPVVAQCWANTFRKNEGILPHRHGTPDNPFKFYSANLFIAGPTKPGTSYENHGDIENEPGTLCVFEYHDMHGVKPNLTDEIRISMALDIYEYTITSHEYQEHFLTNQNRYFLIKNL